MYDIRKIQKNQVGLKLIGTHQLLVCADDMNLLGDNIATMKKNTETITGLSKEGGLEVNAERIESRHQNAVQNQNIKIANSFFENMIFENHSNKSKFDSEGN
jgi:hypothetical protein